MKPKKLNLSEMWKLYLLLKQALGGREIEKSLAEEVSILIDKSTPEALLECLYVIYDNKVRFNNVLEFNSLFINGLMANDFFEFYEFVRGLNGSARE